MLDVSWSELLVVGVVALVAVGPKDLPRVMYTLGRWTCRARAFTHDMGQALEQGALNASLHEKDNKKPSDLPSSRS